MTQIKLTEGEKEVLEQIEGSETTSDMIAEVLETTTRSAMWHLRSLERKGLVTLKITRARHHGIDARGRRVLKARRILIAEVTEIGGLCQSNPFPEGSGEWQMLEKYRIAV